MIYSIADLLKEFSEKENQKLMEQITHRQQLVICMVNHQSTVL